MDALNRVMQSGSMANYGAIFAGFEAKGISADQIKPRENVFTFDAWRELGRQVKKGEHGVTVHTWVSMTKRNEDTGVAEPIGRKPRCSTVFHVSQTEPRAGYSEGLWEYALKHGTTVQAQEDSFNAKTEAHQTAEQQGFKVGGFINAKPIAKPASGFDYYSDQFEAQS